MEHQVTFCLQGLKRAVGLLTLACFKQNSVLFYYCSVSQNQQVLFFSFSGDAKTENSYTAVDFNPIPNVQLKCKSGFTRKHSWQLVLHYYNCHYCFKHLDNHIHRITPHSPNPCQTKHTTHTEMLPFIILCCSLIKQNHKNNQFKEFVHKAFKTW